MIQVSEMFKDGAVHHALSNEEIQCILNAVMGK